MKIFRRKSKLLLLGGIITVYWLYKNGDNISRDMIKVPPNIILIVADDLGWNDVSWHNKEMVTPNMERLAREGIILEQSYVQPVCSPSRYSHKRQFH